MGAAVMTIATRPHETVAAGCSACEYGAHTECSACGCTWDRDIGPRNTIGDACRDGACACHDESLAL